MHAYGLNKHFTTNQDFKLLSFQRADLFQSIALFAK